MEDTKTIDLYRDTRSPAIYHEIAHSKVCYELEEDPTLLNRFEKISVDRNGRSLYNEEKGKTLENLTEKEREYGFLTPYSVKKPSEELAETSNFDYLDMGLLFEEIFTKKNPCLLRKLEYAKKLRIIPREFEEYVRVRHDFKECYDGGMVQDLSKKLTTNVFRSSSPNPKSSEEFGDECKARKFLDYTDDFLHINSGSVYECGIHDLRSRVLKHLDEIDCSREGKRKPDYSSARKEIIQALNSRFKNKDAYTSALFNLRMIYNLRGEGSKADTVSEALKEYERRYSNGKPNLSYVGVNDFLEDNGISLDVHESRRLDSILGGKNE